MFFVVIFLFIFLCKNITVVRHYKCIGEVLLMCKHNMFLWRNKKNYLPEFPTYLHLYSVVLVYRFNPRICAGICAILLPKEYYYQHKNNIVLEIKGLHTVIN